MNKPNTLTRCRRDPRACREAGSVGAVSGISSRCVFAKDFERCLLDLQERLETHLTFYKILNLASPMNASEGVRTSVFSHRSYKPRSRRGIGVCIS